MYNGIGLSSARGSGTNGFIQRNLADIRAKTFRSSDFSSENFSSAPPKAVLKKFNEELLEHERLRKIELKVVEESDKWQQEGMDEQQIEEHAQQLREKLLAELEQAKVAGGQSESAASAILSHISSSSSNSAGLSSAEQSVLKTENSEKLRMALRLGSDYESGAAFQRMKTAQQKELDKMNTVQQPDAVKKEIDAEQEADRHRKRRRSSSRTRSRSRSGSGERHTRGNGHSQSDQRLSERRNFLDRGGDRRKWHQSAFQSHSRSHRSPPRSADSRRSRSRSPSPSRSRSRSRSRRHRSHRRHRRRRSASPSPSSGSSSNSDSDSNSNSSSPSSESESESDSSHDPQSDKEEQRKKRKNEKKKEKKEKRREQDKHKKDDKLKSEHLLRVEEKKKPFDELNQTVKHEDFAEDKPANDALPVSGAHQSQRQRYDSDDEENGPPID